MTSKKINELDISKLSVKEFERYASKVFDELKACENELDRLNTLSKYNNWLELHIDNNDTTANIIQPDEAIMSSDMYEDISDDWYCDMEYLYRFDGAMFLLEIKGITIAE